MDTNTSRRSIRTLRISVNRRPHVLKLRSDQADRVSVDLHHRQSYADRVPFSVNHPWDRLHSPKKNSGHSKIVRYRPQSAKCGRSALQAKLPISGHRESRHVIARRHGLDLAPFTGSGRWYSRDHWMLSRIASVGLLPCTRIVQLQK